MKSCVLLHMRQLFESTIAIWAFVGPFSSVHPSEKLTNICHSENKTEWLLSIAKNIHVLDQLMVGRKCLQTLLTLVRLDISTRVGATRPSPARHLTHASPGTWSSHATMVTSWGCGRGTSKMHCRGFGHQVLKNLNMSYKYHFLLYTG